MTNFTWYFETKVSQTPFSDTITEIHWRIVGEDDGDTASVYGSASLPEPDDSFTLFSDLSEDQVKAWVLDTMEQSESELEQSIQSQIDAIKQPASVFKSLPWQPNNGE